MIISKPDMKKNLIYLLLLFCASLIGAQNSDARLGDSSSEFIYEIVEEHLESFEYTITEYTHEQSATRPTNVQLPSVTRTGSAQRTNSSNSPTGSALKFAASTISVHSALEYLSTNILNSGYSDSGSFFKSLCRLFI